MALTPYKVIWAVPLMDGLTIFPEAVCGHHSHVICIYLFQPFPLQSYLGGVFQSCCFKKMHYNEGVAQQQEQHINLFIQSCLMERYPNEGLFLYKSNFSIRPNLSMRPMYERHTKDRQHMITTSSDHVGCKETLRHVCLQRAPPPLFLMVLCTCHCSLAACSAEDPPPARQ